MNVPQHIAGHLEDYVDGNLNESGLQALDSWMRESDANCEALAGWFMTEARLIDASRLADMRAVFQELRLDGRMDTTDQRRRVKSGHLQGRSRNWALIAASVLVALGIAYIWPKPASKKQPTVLAASASEQSAHKRSPSPAMVGRLADCVWEGDMKPLRVGQDVAAGSIIDIRSGLVQLVFESGAEVVLKGPCRLQVDHSMLCKLFSGNVSAEVPQWAAGFTIRGPAAEVIDLGTRFGFSVGPAGNSEVHVFQGEVISRQLDERGEVVGKEIRLKQHQAILFPGERKQAQRFAANEAKFALEVKPLWRRDQIEPLAVDRKLALWLRAAHGVQTDKKNRVIAWQDLALGSNRIANDAFQPEPKSRPQYALNGLNGRAAIRFDGIASHLTTIPITTTNDQTIVAVFQYAKPTSNRERVGGQIINYNGPPSRFLPDVHSPGVLQLGEKIDVWNGPPFSIAAKAFVGRDSRGADVSAGVVVSEAIDCEHAHAVAFVYSTSQNSAVLYVDGKSVSESSAPTSVAVTSRKVIGKHGIFDQWYFCGDLGELIIFNTALRPDEVNGLSRQLMDHYGVGPGGEASL